MSLGIGDQMWYTPIVNNGEHLRYTSLKIYFIYKILPFGGILKKYL